MTLNRREIIKDNLPVDQDFDVETRKTFKNIILFCFPEYLFLVRLYSVKRSFIFQVACIVCNQDSKQAKITFWYFFLFFFFLRNRENPGGHDHR